MRSRPLDKNIGIITIIPMTLLIVMQALSQPANAAERAAFNYAAHLATQTAAQSLESELTRLGGTSRITLSPAAGSSSFDMAGDVLLPLLDNKNDALLFTQLGLRRADARHTLNLGLGMRYFSDAAMLGSNLFLDNDLTGKNRRWGVGIEGWTTHLRLAANGYRRLTDWHPSRDGAGLLERAANGWDIEAQSSSPAYPHVGGRLKYEKYYGRHVALRPRDSRQDNPSALSAALSWTPMPLFTLEGEHRRAGGHRPDNLLRLMVNYDLGRSLAASLDPAHVASMRSLRGGRFDLVSRNNHNVLDYKKQSRIHFSMNEIIQGLAGDNRSLGINVSSTHGVAKMRLIADEFKAAGGIILNEESAAASIILPARNSETDNTYLLIATAIDSRGQLSTPLQARIIVNAEIDSQGSSAVITDPELVADGNKSTTLTLKLNNKDNKPVSGMTNKLHLAMKSRQLSPLPLSFTQYRETSTPGIYAATLTAGTQAGKVVMVSTLQGHKPFETVVTLKAAELPNIKVAAVTLHADNLKPLEKQRITLTAHVKGSDGKACENQWVTFSSTHKNLQITETRVKTDKNGVARTTALAIAAHMGVEVGATSGAVNSEKLTILIRYRLPS